jgi:hypothetical protein
MQSGDLVFSHSLTKHIAYDYRVYADMDGKVYDDVYGFWQPHPTGSADGFIPASFTSQNLISVEEISSSVDDPWLDADATETIGNNVDVFFNSLLLPNGTYDLSFEGGAY